MSDILHLNEANFDAALDGETPLLVDLWASWCGPCRMIAPILDEVAREYGDRLQVAKIDVDAEPQLAQRFSVRSIPTLVFVRDGEVAQTLVGAVPRQQITEAVDRLLAGAPTPTGPRG